jgi:hypothetical protein
VQPFGLVQSRFLLRLPSKSLAGTSTPVRIEVSDGLGFVVDVETSFLGIVNEQSR